MKNVRMILSAVLVLSIVTGSLAFTGKLFHPATIYCNDATTGNCEDLVQFQTVKLFPTQVGTTNPCGTVSGDFGTSKNISAPCPTTQAITVYAPDNN